MKIPSDPQNLLLKRPKGRVYVDDVGSAHPGHFVGQAQATFGLSVSTEDEEDWTDGLGGVIHTIETDRQGSLHITFWELHKHMLVMSLYGSDVVVATKAAGLALDAVETVLRDDLGVDLGHLDLFHHKLVVAGESAAFDAGETVTGGTSSASGKVAWYEAGKLYLVGVSGAFEAGETLTGGSSASTATLTSADKAQGPVVTDDAAAPTTLYAQGSDYMIDAEYGYLIKISTGSMGASAFVSADREGRVSHSFHGLSSQTVERKVVIVTSANNQGPRFRKTYHRVRFALNGDVTEIGDGRVDYQLQGTVLKDESKPAGEQFFSVEQIEAA